MQYESEINVHFYFQVLVTTKNRLFYCGLNPATLKSLLSSSKKKDKGQNAHEKAPVEEERDFNEPTLIDTSHMAGDITRVSRNVNIMP
jgi:hypothetical protein